jgi:hypothetical protein
MRVIPKMDRDCGGERASLRVGKPSDSFGELLEQSSHEAQIGAPVIVRQDGSSIRVADDNETIRPVGASETDEIIDVEQQMRSEEPELEDGYRMFGSLFEMLERHVCADDTNQEVTDSNAGLISGDGRGLPSSALRVDMDVVRMRGEGVVVDFANAVKHKMRNALNGGNGEVDSSLGAEVADEFQQPDPNRSRGKDFTTVSSEVPSTLDQIQIAPSLQHEDKVTMEQRDSTIIDFKIAELQSSPGSSANLPPVEQIARRVALEIEKVTLPVIASTVVDHQSGGTGQAVRLHLHPVELGAVEITISKRGKRLDVSIAADKEATNQLLRIDADSLLEKLGLSDSQTASIHVRIGSDQRMTEHKEGNGDQSFIRSGGDSTAWDGGQSHRAKGGSGNPKQGTGRNVSSSLQSHIETGIHHQPGVVYI